MPIRFRCPQCDRMLGIATRKAGTQTVCPQCGHLVTVPVQDDRTELADLDALLNPAANGSAKVTTEVSRPVPPKPPRPVPVAELLDMPQSPKPAARPPAPKNPPSSHDRPLFELGDVDAILGVAKTAADRFEVDDDGKPRAKPVSGMDALSLGADATKIVLSPGKATLLTVAVVILLGVAFAAGYMLAPK